MRHPATRAAGLAAACFVVLAVRPAFASSLSATTGNDMGLFTPGQDIGLSFTASGASGQTLTVTFQDADGNVTGTQTASVSSDPWTGTVVAPTAKLGFTRVYGKLSDGTTIAPTGSNAQADGSASFTTYVIVPDPSVRRATLQDTHAYFGLVGGYGGSGSQGMMALLGVRWVKDSEWSWSSMEPSANQRNTFASTPPSQESGWTNGAQPWMLFSLPNLTVNGRPYQGTPDVCVAGTFSYNTCAIDTPYQPDWQTFTSHVASDWPTVYASRAHRIYEVTWEPISPWGYGGTPQELVELYQLAYQSMKAADPTALLAGPTKFCEGQPGAADDVLAAGLAQYIDIFSVHPYVINDVGYYGASLPNWGYFDPELAGLPSRLATQANVVTAAAGKPLPTIGTEQGWPTHQEQQYEIEQARNLVRQNLILLGLGWQTNVAFYLSDYPSGPDSEWMDTSTSFWDYGLFYNLDESGTNGYLPTVIAPKPVAGAYAAMTWLLDDRKAVYDVNYLGDMTRGYVYESWDDPTDEVMALWDFSGQPVTVSITPGVSSVTVYDWMGNPTPMSAGSGGAISLTLTSEPTYIKGVSAAVWGSSRAGANVALNKPTMTSGDSETDGGGSAGGALAVDGDMWANESRWISTSDSSDKWIAVDLGSPTQVGEVRFFTGGYVSGAHQNVYGSPAPSFHVQAWSGWAWTDIVERASNTRAAVDEVFAPVTTSQVRLYFDGNGATTQVSLFELEVISPAATVAPDAGGASFDGGMTAPGDGAVMSGSADGGPAPSSGMGTGTGGSTHNDGGSSPDHAQPSKGGDCSASGAPASDGSYGSLFLVGLACLLFGLRRPLGSLRA